MRLSILHSTILSILKRLPCLPLMMFCLVLPLPGRADERQDKLRNLIHLPVTTASFNFVYSPSNGYTLTTKADAPQDTPVSLRKTLHNKATDAEIYYQIGGKSIEAGKPDEARVAYSRSADLYQQQVNTTPDEGAKRAWLVLALHQAHRATERDIAMADALKRAPRDPQVWDARAALAQADANTILSGQPENINVAAMPMRLATLLKQAPSKEKARAALRLLEEGKTDYDQAVVVAPEDWHGYSNRWLMRIAYQLGTELLNEALQDKPMSEERTARLGTEYTDLLMQPASLNDLTTAARLSHEQPFALGMAAYYLVVQAGLRQPGSVDFQHGGTMAHLSEADQKTVRDLLARLETLTRAANHTLAGQSALVLGVNQWLLFSPEKGSESLLRARTLLPDDPNIVECLTGTYLVEEKFDDVQRVLTDALRHRESARWRLMRAKARERLKQWDGAEADVRLGLKTEPANLDLNLAQCAVLLHKANDDAGRSAFGSQLVHTQKLMGTAFTPEQKFSFNYLGGLYYALNGNAAEAHTYLHNAIGTPQQNADVKAVLALLP